MPAVLAAGCGGNRLAAAALSDASREASRLRVAATSAASAAGSSAGRGGGSLTRHTTGLCPQLLKGCADKAPASAGGFYRSGQGSSAGRQSPSVTTAHPRGEPAPPLPRSSEQRSRRRQGRAQQTAHRRASRQEESPGSPRSAAAQQQAVHPDCRGPCCFTGCGCEV